MFQKASGKRMPVPLDLFVPAVHTVRLDLNRRPAGAYALEHFLSDLTPTDLLKLTKKAGDEIRRRLRLGITTSPFLRSDAVRKLGEPTSNSHLATRFHTVIIDEGQDCDAVELALIAALRQAGCRCVLVADPEQAIFRWRDADPTRLNNLGFTEHKLTGNFRSSATICSAAASLRSEDQDPDRALGRSAAAPHPVYVIAYDGAQIKTGNVLATYKRLLAVAGLRDSDAIVLAHREADAAAAVGRPAAESRSEAAAAVMADAMSLEHTRPSDLRAALELLEKVLLESVDEGARQLPGITRWARLTARQVLGHLRAGTFEPTGVCKATRDLLSQVVPPIGATFATSPSKLFKSKDNAKLKRTAPAPVDAIAASTVHGVKGREFEAVLVIVPQSTRLSKLITAWKDRDPTHDGRAVLYVAATRARSLLAFAVPDRESRTILDLLRRQGADVELVRVGRAAQDDQRSDVQQGGPPNHHGVHQST